VQIAAARLILRLKPRDHVTPALRQLHWLAYTWRVKYKLMHSVSTGRCTA